MHKVRGGLKNGVGWAEIKPHIGGHWEYTQRLVNDQLISLRDSRRGTWSLRGVEASRLCGLERFRHKSREKKCSTSMLRIWFSLDLCPAVGGSPGRDIGRSRPDSDRECSVSPFGFDIKEIGSDSHEDIVNLQKD